jgi:hypothetical protein
MQLRTVRRKWKPVGVTTSESLAIDVFRKNEHAKEDYCADVTSLIQSIHNSSTLRSDVPYKKGL